MKSVTTLLGIALVLIGVTVALEDYSSNDASAQSEYLDELSQSSHFGDYSSEDTFAQDQFGGRSSKLRCSIWTDNDIYMTDDRINLYYWISKPCYVKITIKRPDGTNSVIGPRWTRAGTHSIPGIAKEPFGDRQISLKTWINTRPQQVCRKSCSYTVGFVGLFSPAGAADKLTDDQSVIPSEGIIGEPGDEQYGEPSDSQMGEYDDGQNGEPSDEQLGEPSDEEFGEPSDNLIVEPNENDGQYGEPSDEEFGEPSDSQMGEYDGYDSEQNGEPTDEQYDEPAD